MRTFMSVFMVSLLCVSLTANAQTATDIPSSTERILPENPTFDVDARRAQKLADDLKSPFCPGKTLKTCTSPSAAKVRREIQDMVKQGMSDDAIIAQLKGVHDRGDFSITNPDQPFYTIFLPFLPFVILTVAMLYMIRRWQSKSPGVDAKEVKLSVDEYEGSRAALRARLQSEDSDVEL